MRTWAKALFLIASLMACLWTWNSVSRSMRLVNEPDPTKFNPALIERNLKNLGVVVKVEKVRYVNRDSTTYIFEGKILSYEKEEWKKWTSTVMSNEYSLIVSKVTPSGSFVGYGRGSGPEDVSPILRSKWKEIVK